MNQPIPTNDGDGQAVDTTTLAPSETTDVNETPENTGAEPIVDTVDDVTPDDEGRSDEDLKAERARAVTEAIKKDKEAKQAQTDLAFYKQQVEVQKDPNKIIEIHAQDPEQAEKIAQEVFGKSYQSLLEKEQPAENMSEKDMFAMFQKFQDQQTKSSAETDIDSAVENFFVDNNIMPGTANFRDINEEFHGYSVKDAAQAKIILNALLASKTSDNEEVVDNNAPAMGNRSSMSKKGNKPKLSQAALEVARMSGISAEDLKKYSKK